MYVALPNVLKFWHSFGGNGGWGGPEVGSLELPQKNQFSQFFMFYYFSGGEGKYFGTKEDPLHIAKQMYITFKYILEFQINIYLCSFEK